MDRDGSVTGLIPLLRSDDPAECELAARLIWRRYFHDLLELARNHLDRRIRRRADEEDVVQSMYKSFCLRQQRGEFDEALERRLAALADPELRQIALWRLEGYTNREIAERLESTERLVERRLERIRSKWMSYDGGTP
jgi:DNA-directed RNA polymerase specialized sigma24 family protein